MGQAAVHPDPVRIRLRDVSVVRCVSDSPELEVQVIVPAPNQRGVEEEVEDLASQRWTTNGADFLSAPDRYNARYSAGCNLNSSQKFSKHSGLAAAMSYLYSSPKFAEASKRYPPPVIKAALYKCLGGLKGTSKEEV